MQKSSIRKFLLTAAAAFAYVGLAAQTYHIPANHESQHRNLLASQTPLMEHMKLENTQKFIQDIESREALDDNDIFSAFWDNQSVNPYGSKAIIPDHKDINVASYVHPVKGAVTSEFGYRPSFGRMHKGIDIKLNIGDSIKAAFDGVVRIARYNRGGYGYYVVIRHYNGLETVYGHMSRFLVHPGQHVKAGQLIGKGGNTGRSTGPHLHLETRYMGIAINPRAIIDFENYTTHRDVFAFDRRTCEKAVNYAPRYAKHKAKYAFKSKAKYNKKKATRRKARRR